MKRRKLPPCHAGVFVLLFLVDGVTLPSFAQMPLQSTDIPPSGIRLTSTGRPPAGNTQYFAILSRTSKSPISNEKKRSTTTKLPNLRMNSSRSNSGSIDGGVRKFEPTFSAAAKPSLLKIRAFPEDFAANGHASMEGNMVMQPQPIIMPLGSVRSSSVVKDSSFEVPLGGIGISVNGGAAIGMGLSAAGSVNYVTVDANSNVPQVAYQSAGSQSYMKRYPHAHRSPVELPPLQPAELKQRAGLALERVDQLFNRIEPEILKHSSKTNASTSLHSTVGRSNTRAKLLSRSALIALDISKGLAQDYHLSREQLQYGLPQLNIYSTVLGDVCVAPPVAPCSCKPGKFREIDGFCNNPYHPEWGRSFTPFQRFLPPLYEDGIEAPRAHSITGNVLPSARLVSSVLHPDVDRPHCHYTLLLMHFGQFMDHDINHTPATTLTGYGKAANIQCCDVPYGLPAHPACFPIEIPYSDPYYSKYSLKCMNFVRSEAAPQPGCSLGPREQLNQLTSYLDASQIYGNTYEDMKNIRSYQYGRLRTVFVDYCHKDVLPPDLETSDCPGANATLPCFRAGDSRVNENTGLATLHTIFTREHNRIADELYYLNPYWDDERLFQEARKILGAMLQHILYNEWLPLVLGKDVMYQNDLLPQPVGYYGGYDREINPTIANVFATAALRFGHTLIPSWFRFFNKHHEYIGQKQLRDAFFKPYPLYQPGVIDMYLLGMINDNIQKRDSFITSEVTEHLFENIPYAHGVDLAAINVQRGRDHGIPPYNAWREFCGLPKAYTFDDLKDVMRSEIVERLKTVYENVDDIDLFPAGIAEEPLHDGLLGPTFTCILTKQFVHLKRGDRFWYENDIQPQAFTPDQLREIRRSNIARVICDNSDDVETIQPHAFLHVLPTVNERVPCKGPFLPRIDLSAWKEVPRETADLKGAIHEAVQEVVSPRGGAGDYKK